MKIRMPDGTMVEATDMDFRTIKEEWNEYELEDGTKIKLKTSASKIYRLAMTDVVTGQHQYFLQHNTTVAASEPEKKPKEEMNE